MKNETNFLPVGNAGMCNLSAVAESIACEAGHSEALAFGFALRHGLEDGEEGTSIETYGTVTGTGVRRGALPVYGAHLDPVDPASYEERFLDDLLAPSAEELEVMDLLGQLGNFGPSVVPSVKRELVAIGRSVVRRLAASATPTSSAPSECSGAPRLRKHGRIRAYSNDDALAHVRGETPRTRDELRAMFPRMRRSN